MLVALLIVALGILSLVVVAYPLLTSRGAARPIDDPAVELAQRLRRARDRVYEEIRALQQERFMRDITEEQYQEQLNAARLRAAQLLQEQRRVQETIAEIEAAVEAGMARAERRPA